MHKSNSNIESVSFEFDDNLALINLFGQYDENLLLIEKMNEVSINRIGNKINIKGDKQSIDDTHLILTSLYDKVKNGEEIDDEKIKDVKSVITLNNGANLTQEDLFITIGPDPMITKEPIIPILKSITIHCSNLIFLIDSFLIALICCIEENSILRFFLKLNK